MDDQETQESGEARPVFIDISLSAFTEIAAKMRESGCSGVWDESLDMDGVCLVLGQDS
jgi:hypothetical protein